jgi:hypothetical protein
VLHGYPSLRQKAELWNSLHVIHSNCGKVHDDWLVKEAFLQVADRLEQSVSAALDAGYRTKDLMSEGMTEVKCSELGEILVAEAAKPAARQPVAA